MPAAQGRSEYELFYLKRERFVASGRQEGEATERFIVLYRQRLIDCFRSGVGEKANC